jgi:UDP-glucuronate 4-epimerase
MNIIVTGGAGFIGSHLVATLLEKGEKVSVIDDFNSFYDPALKRENIEPFLSNPNFTLHELDIRDLGSLRLAIGQSEPDVICHLAARAGVRPSISEPILYEEVNCLGTLNILESIKGLGLKNFVFAASSSVYGLNSKSPFSEDDPITMPISPYASTKRAGELMCFTYAHLYGLPVTCLRFFTVYGEAGRPEMAVAKFTRAIYDGTELPVYGDGSAIRDFTYVGDIIEGVMGSIYNPFEYEIINIGGSKTIDVNGLISIIEDKLGKKAKVKYLDAAPGDVPLTYADVSKARRMIGYEPKIGVEAGVERYVKWFLAREERGI